MIFNEFITLLTYPPGNLAYHLILAFAITGTLQAALSQWRAAHFPQARRMALGLGLILALRVGLFVLAGVAWQGLLNERLVMPPVERAVDLAAVVILIWLWAFPEPLRLADAAAWLLGLLVCTIAALNQVWWSGQGGASGYNGSWADFINEVAASALLVIGLALLALRRPNGWGFGAAMLALLLAGHAAYLLLPTPAGDFAGLVRLAQVAAYPLLLSLPQRFPVSTAEGARPAIHAQPERRRLGADPALLGDILAMSAADDPPKARLAVARSLAGSLLADICLLAVPANDKGDLDIAAGYDLIRQSALDGFFLTSRQAPQIAEALRRRRTLRLPASSTSADLKSLTQYLNLEQAGHLMALPIAGSRDELLAALLLLSPYSNRAWSEEDERLARLFAAPVAHLLQQNHSLGDAQTQLALAQKSLQEVNLLAARHQQENETLRNSLQAATEENKKNLAQAQSLADLVAAQSASQALLAALQTENELLKKEKNEWIVQSQTPQPENAAAGATDTLAGELRLALEEVAQLKAALAASESPAEASARAPQPGNLDEIAAIAQELRQPMSSVIGYTDFLLGESIGILGALQRKFLERVKISTERMNRLVNDLARLTQQAETASPVAYVEAFPMREVIAAVRGEAEAALHARGVTLLVDIPAQEIVLQSDPEALQQALTTLLDNAIQVTPQGGEVRLAVSQEDQELQTSYLLLRVSDQGGGIPQEHIPNVLSRLSFTNESAIPGVSSEANNLPAARVLVENLGGRIWVDSQPGVGSSFSILLALSPSTQTANNGGEAPA
ncbi:MAG: ATP-binding protein [Chloroflexi bacterium]|nr:ATP-binding protein [Chloroflexota bacterium]